MGSPAIELERGNNLLEVECIERGNKVIRHVTPTRLSLERLRFIWDKLKDYDVLFNDMVRGDFQAFIDHFIVRVDGEYTAAGLMWDVDDVGMFFLNEIVPGVSGCAHFVFWDGVFKGREKLCRAMLRHVFTKYKFIRVETKVPLYATTALVATNRIGFVQEGRLRMAVLYKGQWFDLNIYSVIPSDLNNADVAKKDLSNWENRKQVCLECRKIHTRKED